MAGQQTHPMVHFAAHENIVVGTLYKYSVLNPANIEELANQLLTFTRRQPGINLLIDVSHVDYFPNEVLDTFVRLKKTVDMLDGHMRICGAGDAIVDAFVAAGLKDDFIIHSDEVQKDFARFKRSLSLAAQEAKWEDPMAQ